MSLDTATRTFDASQDFANRFDISPFKFNHHMSEHELFSMPAIRKLVQRFANLTAPSEKGHGVLRAERPQGYLYIKGTGNVEWHSGGFEKKMMDSFDHLETSGCRIKLTDFNRYDEYAQLLDEWLADLSEVTGIDILKEFHAPMVTMFISSPNEVTPYHIDMETNCLLQLHGQKVANIYDGNDPTVVSPRNLEEYWDGKIYIDRSMASIPETFVIGPGEGVHQPAFFPHLIEVRDHVSVSVSFIFLRTRFPRAEINRVNSYIRKAGLEPSAPGKRPIIDKLKCSTMRNALALKRTIKGS
ncbi:MAG: hypothetical protein ABI197_11800 [Granulicella sp.]